MSALTVGVQEPRIKNYPSYRFSEGDDACELGAAYGLTPDPWQELLVKSCLGVNARGRLVAGLFGVAVPRQNGKNGFLEIVELYKAAVQGRKILHTAHEVKTARKHFLRMKSFFENDRKYPELAAAVVAIRSTNGQESILLKNGGSIEFVARSRGSGRGFTVDDLVFDEAQELTDEQLEALLPTISSAPSGDPQQIHAGTPPGPTSPGEVFTRIRNEGVAGKTKRMAWFEWSISEDIAPDVAVRSWREYAFATNPALGVRLNIQTVQDEVTSMSPEGFARERLGRWDVMLRGTLALDPAGWRRLFVDPGEVPEGRVAYGVRFSPDGSAVGLSVAVRTDVPGVPVHVEAVKLASMGEGTGWLVDGLVEVAPNAAQIVIDGKYGVGFLINELRDRGVRNKRLILTPSLDQVTAANSMLEQGVSEMTVSTVEQPDVVAEVESVTKRKIGNAGGWGFQAADGGTSVLLESMALALWGAKTTKRRPKSGGGVTIL